jgi:hypothetical protein
MTTTVPFGEFRLELREERRQIFYFPPDLEKEYESDEESGDKKRNENDVCEVRKKFSYV